MAASPPRRRPSPCAARAARWWPAALAVSLAEALGASAVSLRRGADLAVARTAEMGIASVSFAMHGLDWKGGYCFHKDNQSPIDLPADGAPGPGFFFKYKPGTEPVELKNEGDALALDLAGLGFGGVSYNGGWYELMSITAKSQSEHTFAGAAKTSELHMVHKSTVSGELLIVALPLDCANPPVANASAAPGPAPAPAPASAAPAPAPTPAAPAPAPAATALAAAAPAPAPADGPLGAPAPSPAPGPGPAPANMSNASNASGLPWFATMFPFLVAPSWFTAPPANEPNFNPWVQAFLKVPPPREHMKVIVPVNPFEPLDLNALVSGAAPAAGAPAPAPAPAPGPAPAAPYYAYNGSLTVPPCAENVVWFVKKDPVMISDTQARMLQQYLYNISDGAGNFRSVQPLGTRTVQVVEGAPEAPPPPPWPAVPIPPDMTSREQMARMTATNALHIAKIATEEVRAMDMHERAAANAFKRSMQNRMMR